MATVTKQDVYEVVNPAYKTLQFCSFDAASRAAREFQKTLVRQGLGCIAREIKVRYIKTIEF